MSSTQQQQQYHKIELSSEPYADHSSNPDSDMQYADTEGLLNSRQKLSQRGRSKCHPLVYAIISFFALALAFMLGGAAGSRYMPSTNPDKTCASYTNSYSPVVKDVGIKYSTIPFNGSLMHANEFRQPAGPEVDAAWQALGVDYRALRIPEAEGEASGLSGHVRINPQHGGGYPANVEGLHQLHCLNLLRKSLYYNYDYYHKMGMGPFSNSDNILQLHVTHCLDIIRQQLMCQVDTGVLGQIWTNPEEPNPFVDFNTEHKCKNFEAVRDWAKERQLPEDVPDDFLLPPTPDDIMLSEIP